MRQLGCIAALAGQALLPVQLCGRRDHAEQTGVSVPASKLTHYRQVLL